MRFAIRHPDGSRISAREYADIRSFADIVAQKLLALIESDRHMAILQADNFTLDKKKKSIKVLFRAEYRDAMLELEAEKRLLCLCSAHWKADAMLGAALL